MKIFGFDSLWIEIYIYIYIRITSGKKFAAKLITLEKIFHGFDFAFQYHLKSSGQKRFNLQREFEIEIFSKKTPSLR